MAEVRASSAVAAPTSWPTGDGNDVRHVNHRQRHDHVQRRPNSSGTSRQRQVQRRALPYLIDGRFMRIVAVDSEPDGGTDLASGNRVGTYHVDAESGEVVDTPGRGDCAQGLPDVGLHAGAGRQPSVACVEDLAGEPDDRSDTAGGRRRLRTQG